jgi:hypothetical protein
MAAKATVRKVTAKATVQKAAPKGLQLTTAQQAAYSKAYAATATAARTRLALNSSAQGLRKYRLQAANATVKKASAARSAAQTAAIAAAAAHRSFVQSRLAHQNSALQARIELNMANHASLSGRLQYIAAGEKAYAHSAVMRTLDTAQALSSEARVFAAVSKTAKKASKSVLAAHKPGPNSAAVAKVATAAGLKAAKAVSPRTAPNPGNRRPRSPRREWLGDDVTPNCVITAVANHLLFARGVLADECQMRELYEACRPEPVIEEVLWTAYVIGWPWGKPVRLASYTGVHGKAVNGSRLVIGFKALCNDGTARDHAALSIGFGKVVSWGLVTERREPVEEAWALEWAS